VYFFLFLNKKKVPGRKMSVTSTDSMFQKIIYFMNQFDPLEKKMEDTFIYNPNILETI
jgi:hypothetical protein